MKSFFPRIKVFLLILGDIVFLYASLRLMLEIEFGAKMNSILWNEHFFAFSAIFPLWLLSFYIFGLYDLNIAKNNVLFYSAVLKATILNGFLSVTLFYLFPDFLGVTPKTNLFLTLLFFGIFVAAWRYLYNLFLKSPTLLREVIIVGKGDQVQELAERINSNPQFGYKVVSIINPEDKKSLTSLPSTLHTLVCAVNISKHAELANILFNSLAHFNFETFPSFYEKITGKIPLSEIDETWFLHNLKERERTVYEKIKRLIDLFLGAFFFLATALIFPFATLMIKMDSPGPVFYKQERIGKNGKTFFIYKFRSMENNGKEYKKTWREKDPKQITKTGKFLRRFHIDELPQSLSIITGNLSLVGPRPEWIRLGKIFEKNIDFYFQRYLIKPGITGWAQIHFPASLSVSEAKEKFQYDLFYIKNRSFFLDLGIVLKTVSLIFKGRI